MVKIASAKFVEPTLGKLGGIINAPEGKGDNNCPGPNIKRNYLFLDTDDDTDYNDSKPKNSPSFPSMNKKTPKDVAMGS
jgi:hypothetical protein